VADVRRPRSAARRLGRRRALTAPARAGTLIRLLAERFPQAATSLWTDDDTVEIQVGTGEIVDTLRALRDDPEFGFLYLADAAAVDYGVGEHFEVVYHLFSYGHPAWLRIRVPVDRATPHAPTITGLWAGAMHHEREMYDMMGIVFDGNRDLRRIYMSPDYRSFPQRKDFLLPDDAADSPAAGVSPLERPETWDLTRFTELSAAGEMPTAAATGARPGAVTEGAAQSDDAADTSRPL
jgi:NADH:ubiquinone oxidoreductase subunit C